MESTKSQSNPAARTAAHDFQLMRDPIRVLIAEDQRFVADALHSLLSRQPGMVIVGTTGAADDPIARIFALRPDVVLLQFRLSEECTETARTIRERSAAKIIFLTGSETESIIMAAIEYGASAVLTMSTAADEVVRAIRLVAGGGTLITAPTIASALRRRRATDGLRDKLTSREREVLSLLSGGISSREIATSMGIEYTTVRSHLRNVAFKLDAHSKLEVLVKAQRLELIGGPNPVRALRGDPEYQRAFAASE